MELEYKTKTIYLDSLIWPSSKPKTQYGQMFEHYYLISPVLVKDPIDWLDYLKGNRN